MASTNTNPSALPHEMIYFDTAGRGEATRILLHAANIDFKDTRIAGKDWPEWKARVPLGFVPVLKIDGVSHCQSLSMARYAAKLAGWYPSDPVECLIVDEVMDTLNGIFDDMPRKQRDAKGDMDVLKTLRQEHQSKGLKQTFDFIEGWIIKNGGTYVVGAKPTVADLLLVPTVQMFQAGFFDFIDTNFIDAYPGIISTTKAVQEHDAYKSYYASIQK